MALKIWFDIVNTCHAQLLYPFVSRFRERYDILLTCRDFAETVYLIDQWHIPYKIYGKFYGKNRIRKFLGLLYRNLKLLKNLPNYDVSITCSGTSAPYIGKIRSKKCIIFKDSAIVSYFLSNRFSDYLFYPAAVSTEKLLSQGVSKEKLYQYHGFKEDIYIADYTPDSDFLEKVSFNEFVSLRPECWKADYYPRGVSSIVPNLLKLLNKEGINVIYFPRYPEDNAYAKGYDNVYIPPNPLNGLDVCYYSKAVLTGSGTFAREAACIGTPAVSFFPGKQLSVDQKMVNDGWMFHSRDPEEIVEYVLNSKKRKVDLSRSKKVQKEVFDIIGVILEEIEKKKKR